MEKTKAIFLVNENNDDVFAFFPEEEANMYVSEMKTSYSHIGQHSACHLDYARESRLATKKEYSELKTELETIGYDLELVTKF